MQLYYSLYPVEGAVKIPGKGFRIGSLRQEQYFRFESFWVSKQSKEIVIRGALVLGCVVDRARSIK